MKSQAGRARERERESEQVWPQFLSVQDNVMICVRMRTAKKILILTHTSTHTRLIGREADAQQKPPAAFHSHYTKFCFWLVYAFALISIIGMCRVRDIERAEDSVRESESQRVWTNRVKVRLKVTRRVYCVLSTSFTRFYVLCNGLFMFLFVFMDFREGVSFFGIAIKWLLYCQYCGYFYFFYFSQL